MARPQQSGTKSNKVIKATSGRNKPKVKSACRTCKLRKVKCDEGWPACNRCISANRTCEGYGIWGGGGSAHNPGSSSASPESTDNPPTKVPICRNEARIPTRKSDAKYGSSKSPMSGSPSPDAVTAEDYSQLAQTSQALNFPERDTGPETDQRITRSIPQSVAGFPRSTQDGDLMYWFKRITADKLPGLFSSEFWHMLLPQACYSEPAVLHGVLALTSAHKTELLQPAAGQASVEERFTLQAYSRAIRNLEPHFRLESNASLRVTLITCILFVCLELVRRRRAMAVSHLSNGLKLIAQSELCQNGIRTKTYLNDPTSNLIAQMFVKLSLQVNLLAHSHLPPGFNFSGPSAEAVPNRFLSVEEARECLDKLIARALQLDDLCRKQERFQQEAQYMISNQRIALQEDLSSWSNTYTVSGIETDPALILQGKIARVKAAGIILHMYHTMAVIMAECCVFPRQETVFDYQGSNFISLMAKAIKMWKIVATWHEYTGPQPPGDATATIVDIGWIPALYYAAIKCRIHRIRLHAIRLLESTFHTEGVWDAAVVARVAREVMRIEEGPELDLRVYSDIPLDRIPQQAELLPPSLPESQRVHDIEVIHPSEGHGKVELMCRRRRDDGSWEDINREYDPITGIWADKTYLSEYNAW